jgi:formylglycine-generating enzyme required for sulfatase activity
MPQRFAILFFIAGAAGGCLHAYQAPAPCLARPPAERSYTRVRLLGIVSSQTPVRAEYLIRTCGVRIPFDSELEADLREAGAGDRVIAAVRAAALRKDEPEPPPANPGDVRLNPKDGLRYVYIPPGTFRMGCSPGDGACGKDEHPAHEVRIAKAFWMGQTHVTVEAFKKYSRATKRDMPDEPSFDIRRLNPHWNHESVPMTMVTWRMANEYCEWTGLRLPTEAEWEYAARAGTTGPRYGEIDEIAWWGANAGSKPLDADAILKSGADYAQVIAGNGNAPRGVAQKKPNAFKLYDMLGNVWHWTSDWYKNTYDSEAPEVDPTGPPGGDYRVLRGGSFFNDSALIRVSFRGRTRPPAYHDFGNGFRCAGPVLRP